MNQECEKGALHKNLGVSCLAGRGAKSHKKEVCNLEISLRANALYILIYPKLRRKEGKERKHCGQYLCSASGWDGYSGRWNLEAETVGLLGDTHGFCGTNYLNLFLSANIN